MTDDTLPVTVDPSPKGTPIPGDDGTNVINLGTHGKGPHAPPPPPFTQEDVNNIVIMVERAPLQNLNEGRAVLASMQRFVQFVTAHNPPQS